MRARPWDTGRIEIRFGRIMQRLLSTYLFVSRKLTPEILEHIAGAGFQGIEIFCTRSHFEYSMKSEISAMPHALEAHKFQPVSLHGPPSRNVTPIPKTAMPPP